MKVISRAEAKEQGLKTYYINMRCSHGHDAPRYVNSRKCIECHKERNARRKKGKANKSGKATKSAKSTVVVPTEVLPPGDWRSYATKIAAAWERTTESIIESGRLLNEAKAEVEHGDWLKLIQTLPFSEDTAQRLMAIARHPVLSNTAHVRFLPPSRATLLALTKLPDRVLLARIEDHTIHPDMQRKEVAVLLGPKPPRKRNNKPSPSETYVAVVEENEDLRAHIAELEAAREMHGVAIDAADTDAELAQKILGCVGHRRLALLIDELMKLMSAPVDDTSDTGNKVH